ncbi:MAG: outer membrane lipoprotein-sorting protein [Bacteroidia bacterium]|nr:outer membrane lipoprotein-sorting protein [Bacteroidia bacterium]
MKLKSTLILFFSLLLVLPSQAQDAASILKTSEEKRRGVSSSVAEMSMTIVRPKWTRSMNMKSWSKGDDYALILITGPAAKDKGTATLKRKKEVWNWLPRIERTVKLPPSMMSQSWMGSDLSNDDLVREVSLVEDYDSKVMSEETIDGRKCWKIELIPHDDAAIVWAKVIMYIDQKDYLQMKTEFIDEDDELVNVFLASEIKTMGGRPMASKMELIPLEDEGHKTILEYKSIKFDVPMNDNFFSVQNMKRIK